MNMNMNMSNRTMEQPIQVLLVEDDPEDVELLQETLAGNKNLPLSVEVAGCLSSGIKRLKDNHIDVVLLDLGLPDSEGLETIRQWSAHAPHPPTIVLTGLDDTEMGMKAVQAGAEDFLLKGELDCRSFSRTLRYAIERKKNKELLEKNEEYLRLMFDSVTEGVTITDKEGNIIKTNQAAARIHGYGLRPGWS